MRIIPAIDIIDGKCVRLTQGDYNQKKVYSENPVDVAKSFQDAGLEYLHLVDLDGAKAGKVTNWKVIREICSNTALNVDFGGGVKTEEDVEKLFDEGIKQVTLGSIAVKDPDKVSRWIARFGTERIILGADVKDEKIAISGWLESADMHIISFLADYSAWGIEHVVCTDISTDGTLKGPNLLLYTKITEAFPEIKLIASGGIGSMEDLRDLEKINIEGVIIGKAIYEGKISLAELAMLK